MTELGCYRANHTSSAALKEETDAGNGPIGIRGTKEQTSAGSSSAECRHQDLTKEYVVG